MERVRVLWEEGSEGKEGEVREGLEARCQYEEDGLFEGKGE